MPPHRTDPRIDSCPELQPSSDATPCLSAPIRLIIWAAANGDEHSGIRRLEARWAARQAAQGLHAQPEQPGPSRIRGAPDPSSDAAWMHPSRSRPPPLRDRAPLQPALPATPDAEAARAQAAAPTQRQRLAAALRTDNGHDGLGADTACHRMCCGPDTLQWFALSVFRNADIIGIDGHVSFLPHTHTKKKKPGSEDWAHT